MPMRKLIHAVAMAALLQAGGLAQTAKPTTILPHTVIGGGARLKVPVNETVSEVVLESKPKNAKQ